MCTTTHDDNDDFTIEIDSEVYSQDFDEAYPAEEEQEYQETDILFE